MKAKISKKKNIGLFCVLAGIIMLLTGVLYLHSGQGAEKTEEDAAPDYVTAMLLSPNAYSRPGNALTEVNNVVIHYVANPGSSAEANRNYFNNLQFTATYNPDGIKASAHFIVGLEGEVIQCIPTTEIAYANYPRNNDTISIEVCHPDESGKFSDVTYEALTTFTADLLKNLGLTADDVIRHYDCNGKNCPKYYVENEDAWEQLIEDVRTKMDQDNLHPSGG